MSKKPKKPRLRWEEISKIAYAEAKNYYQMQNSALTLRGLFYILVSKNVLPNTKQAYKTLSVVLAKLRYENKFPAYLITDVTRISEDLEKFEKFAKELSEEEIKQEIERIIASYSSYSINPWSDQPNRIIVCIEKEALYNLTKTWIKELKVNGTDIGIYNLRCLKGFDSATDIISLSRQVNSLKNRGFNPIILIISDFDPSGEEIYNDFKNRIIELSGIKDLIVEKIMVTKEQIQQFNLPSAPESADEIAKLRRDPRYKKFVEVHGLMRVETDALYSLYPDKAKEILHNAILKYFDKNIFETKTKLRIQEAQKQSEEARNKMKEKVKKILGER